MGKFLPQLAPRWLYSVRVRHSRMFLAVVRLELTTGGLWDWTPIKTFGVTTWEKAAEISDIPQLIAR